MAGHMDSFANPSVAENSSPSLREQFQEVNNQSSER